MAEIEISYPFSQNGWHNIVMCQICGLESYAGKFFGDKLKGIYLSATMSTHLSEILRKSSRRGVDITDMICPKCGAKPDVTTGNRITNFIIGSPSWPITL